jgi:hypothetical protein
MFGRGVDETTTTRNDEPVPPRDDHRAVLVAASEPTALIKGTQWQKTGVRTDLPTGKISSNGLVSVEGKGQLWYTTRCHLWDAPKENAGFAKTQCSSILLEHPFFFHQ